MKRTWSTLLSRGRRLGLRRGGGRRVRDAGARARCRIICADGKTRLVARTGGSVACEGSSYRWASGAFRRMSSRLMLGTWAFPVSLLSTDRHQGERGGGRSPLIDLRKSRSRRDGGIRHVVRYVLKTQRISDRSCNLSE